MWLVAAWQPLPCRGAATFSAGCEAQSYLDAGASEACSDCDDEEKDTSALLQVGALRTVKRASPRLAVPRPQVPAAHALAPPGTAAQQDLADADTSLGQQDARDGERSALLVGPGYTARLGWLEIGVAVVELTLAMALLRVAVSLFIEHKDIPRVDAPLEPVESPAVPKEDAELGGSKGNDTQLGSPREPPQPAPRLTHVGTSFVIPTTKLGRSGGSLEFEIAVKPALWPLRARLTRRDPFGPWERLDVTADILSDAGLPSLFMVAPSNRRGAHGAAMEGTGGTDGETESESTHLELWDHTGEVAASISVPDADGACEVDRGGKVSWVIHTHATEGADCGQKDVWFSVTKKGGQEVALATRLARSKQNPVVGEEEYFQVDTQPDSGSPDAALILGCLLGRLAFHGNDGQGGG